MGGELDQGLLEPGMPGLVDKHLEVRGASACRVTWLVDCCEASLLSVLQILPSLPPTSNKARVPVPWDMSRGEQLG